MNNNSINSDKNVIKEFEPDKLSNIDIESNKFGDITDLIKNNSNQLSGWIGTPQQERQNSLDSSGCDCPDCCGAIAPDFEFGTTTDTNSSLNTNTPLFASASAEAVTTSVPYSGNRDIDALLYPAKWTTNTITYSFFDGGSYYGSEGNAKEIPDFIKNRLRNILESFERYIPINFQEVSDAGDNFGQIRYLYSDGPSTAYTKVPYKYQNSRNDRFKGGDIHLNINSIKDKQSEDNTKPGDYRYETLIHESLHALNLKHPGNYNGSSNGGQSGVFLPYADDNSNHSILSYNRLRSTQHYSGTITPMAYDIRALQYLYGAADYHGENTTYKFAKIDEYTIGGEFFGNKNSNSKQTVWDSGGKDNFDFSELSFDRSGYLFDLRQGGVITSQNAYLDTQYEARGSGGKKYQATSRGTFLAYNMTIENVVNSSSDDTIVANGGANTFSGYGKGRATGNDVIYDADSKDTLDLSEYKVSDFTTTTQGNDYVIDLGNNKSVTIKDYFKVAAGDRINILTAGGNPNPNPDPNPNPTPADGTLVWEKQGFQDESAVAPDSSLDLGNGVTATVDWSIITDGGSFTPHVNEKDYVTYDSGILGNHKGYLSLGFDNSKDDPDDLIKLDLKFNKAVTGLTFSILDVDQGSGKKFDDGVEIYADGVNIKNLSGVEILTGNNVMADNEPYMNGFEGRGNAGANSTSEGGNINISFGSTEVSALEIKYFSTDDAISNPGSQKIGISDLDFQIKSV
ncbi:MAG: M10 family metallopeptidase [Xenococcaceae cyanobacterium MO_188.B32]|nr:M10 family metallopeptidase [Xenococcaceae cyanobacterium MO_188.B32]